MPANALAGSVELIALAGMGRVIVCHHAEHFQVQRGGKTPGLGSIAAQPPVAPHELEEAARGCGRHCPEGEELRDCPGCGMCSLLAFHGGHGHPFENGTPISSRGHLPSTDEEGCDGTRVNSVLPGGGERTPPCLNNYAQIPLSSC